MPVLLVETDVLTGVVNVDIAAVELTVNFSGVASAVTVTITRTDPDGSRAIVRGADRATLSAGRFFVVDSEAPLGVEVSYVATGYDTTGMLVVTSNTLAVTIGIDRGQAWLKDPGRPSLAVSPKVVTLPEVTRDIRRGMYHIAGAPFPVVRSDVRHSETGTMVLRTHSIDDAAALDFLFSAGAVLLFQSDPGYGIDQFYFSAGKLTQARFDPRNGFDPWRVFDVEYVKTSAPVGGSGVTVTYSSVTTAYATYQALFDAHDDYLSVLSGGY